jgi:hypothetical protein
MKFRACDFGIGDGQHTRHTAGDEASMDSLRRDPLRAQFTTSETVNATEQLREGHKVVVKGSLVEMNGSEAHQRDGRARPS